MSDDTSTNLEVAKPATDDATLNDDPTDNDFDEDITEKERIIYKDKFKDLNTISQYKLHCSSCDKHLGCAAKNESRMRTHPMLRTLVCHTCHAFYNSGEFEKGDDGSELYCRWCGQGGQVFCCSDCPHVFCAKCIRRNLGTAMIKQIESADDWKCFKCNPEPLFDLRAICWALLRYCDLKNKLAYKTEDPDLKEKYQKECALDASECCKDKMKRKSLPPRKKETEKEKEEMKKKTESPVKKITDNILSKIPSTIQVKKFATINDDIIDKKRKRGASPKNKPMYKNPITIANYATIMKPQFNVPPPKRPRAQNIIYPNTFKPMDRRFPNPMIKMAAPLRPRMTLPMNPYNRHVNIPPMAALDNINLSLESLTQGLDFSAVAAMAGNCGSNDAVVCTPDFPMEPLCEVTEEDPTDDDVQCITPAPTPKSSKPNAKVNSLPDLCPDNIVQMSDNDVTVNAVTGGLKFRVDPQTLSSNKMYRLPDGRIFAINANSRMPGGYSATIVAVSDQGGLLKSAGGKTFAAKLSAVSTQPPPLTRSNSKRNNKTNKSVKKPVKITTNSDVNMNIPVEWLRYNIVDAVDAVNYSLNRLNRLKTQATTVYLRSRTEEEITKLYKSFDRLLNTSATRIAEVREVLTKDYEEYLTKSNQENEDDDDVQILTTESTDDPIYIDENSLDSQNNNEDDVTCLSDHNDSTEKEVTMLDSSHTTNEVSFDKNKAIPEKDADDENSKDSAQKNNDDKEIDDKNVDDKDNDDKDIDDKDNDDKDKDDDDDDKDNNDDDIDKEKNRDKEIEKEFTLKKDDKKDGEKNDSNTNEDKEEEDSDKKNDMNGHASSSMDVDNPETSNSDDMKEDDLLSDQKGDMENAEITDDIIDKLLKDDPSDNAEVSRMLCLDSLQDSSILSN